MSFRNREQIPVGTWGQSRRWCDRIPRITAVLPRWFWLWLGFLAMLFAFRDLPGLLACIFLEAAPTAHSPASHRIACRNPWPLVDPDHQGDDLIPHRVPGGPEKECRWSGHHGKPEKQFPATQSIMLAPLPDGKTHWLVVCWERSSKSQWCEGFTVSAATFPVSKMEAQTREVMAKKHPGWENWFSGSFASGAFRPGFRSS